MSKRKVKNTAHSYQRAYERLGLYKCEALKLIKEAQRSGKNYENLPDGPIKDFIRTKGSRKRVKVYKNYVFVFQKTSTACITMYKIDSDLIEKQKVYDQVVSI